MKYIYILLFVSGGLMFAQTNPKHVQVNGYTRSDGTYVAPYVRTAPNSTNSDNFSTIGNTNPYTGEAGYIPSDDNYDLDYTVYYTKTDSFNTKINNLSGWSNDERFRINSNSYNYEPDEYTTTNFRDYGYDETSIDEGDNAIDEQYDENRFDDSQNEFNYNGTNYDTEGTSTSSLDQTYTTSPPINNIEKSSELSEKGGFLLLLFGAIFIVLLFQLRNNH